MRERKVGNNLLIKRVIDLIPSECRRNKNLALQDEILSRFDIQDWWFQEVKTWNGDNYKEVDFIEEDVELSKIVGTDHASYDNRTWLEMLCTLKRNKYATDIEQLQDCLNSWNGKKEKIQLHKFRGEYYISLGNHRICQAKFAGIPFVHAQVYVYKEK